MDGPFQSASYRNARVDTLLDAIARTTDRERVRRMYADVQKILRDEQPWGFLFYPPELIVKSDRVQGTPFDIRGVLAEVERWYAGSSRASAARN
jgi:ABC-type transport system substrate-binding protein